MPSPHTPSHIPPKAPPPPAPFPPARRSARVVALQQLLDGIAETERMTALVDYLHDLRKEFDATAAELKSMGFCAPCYFSMLDDDDDHDCPEEDS